MTFKQTVLLNEYVEFDFTRTQKTGNARYHETLWRVRATFVTVERQKLLCIKRERERQREKERKIEREKERKRERER